MSRGWDTLNYKRFEHIEDSSESDGDCHPNIDLGSWKRMKSRMRNEKGLPPRGVELRDAYDVVKINQTKNSPEDDSKENVEDFFKKYRSKLETYAYIPDDKVADEFLQKNQEIVTHSGEGFLITLAVDKSCEGMPASLNVPLIAKRCLTMHNILASAKEANIKIEKSIEMFYRRKKHAKISEMYTEEFNKQNEELLSLIKKRTKERLKEAEEEAKKPIELTPEEQEEFKAPIGPGGLDPTEVLNSLPQEMQDAFLEKDTEKLTAALSKLPAAEAHKYMEDCVKSGLWVRSAEEEEPETEDVTQETKEANE